MDLIFPSGFEQDLPVKINVLERRNDGYSTDVDREWFDFFCFFYIFICSKHLNEMRRY